MALSVHSRVVSYQVGVDTLGFPIYIQHEVFEGISKTSKIDTKPKGWVSVIQKIIKQH